MVLAFADALRGYSRIDVYGFIIMSCLGCLIQKSAATRLYALLRPRA